MNTTSDSINSMIRFVAVPTFGNLCERDARCPSRFRARIRAVTQIGDQGYCGLFGRIRRYHSVWSQTEVVISTRLVVCADRTL